MEDELDELSQAGWLVVHRDRRGAQLRRPKRWSRTGLVVFVLLPLLSGVVFPPLFAVAAFGVAFVLLDYLLKRDQVRYVSADD